MLPPYQRPQLAARGGKTEAENLQLLCRVHNNLVARLQFGDDFMDRKMGQKFTSHGKVKLGHAPKAHEERCATADLGK